MTPAGGRAECSPAPGRDGGHCPEDIGVAAVRCSGWPRAPAWMRCRPRERDGPSDRVGSDGAGSRGRLVPVREVFGLGAFGAVGLAVVAAGPDCRGAGVRSVRRCGVRWRGRAAGGPGVTLRGGSVGAGSRGRLVPVRGFFGLGVLGAVGLAVVAAGPDCRGPAPGASGGPRPGGGAGRRAGRGQRARRSGREPRRAGRPLSGWLVGSRESRRGAAPRAVQGAVRLARLRCCPSVRCPRGPGCPRRGAPRSR
ncbi:hypothetical protein SUDANB130_03632 [Streptomyces sp. enrichment culture]